METDISLDSSSVLPTDLNKSIFSSSNVVILVGENMFVLRVLKMTDSTMIFVSNADPEFFDEMGISMPITTSEHVIGTTVLGAHINSESQLMAEKFTKNFHRQIYVSFNAKIDRMLGPLLERKINEYIRGHQQEFL